MECSPSLLQAYKMNITKLTTVRSPRNRKGRVNHADMFSALQRRPMLQRVAIMSKEEKPLLGLTAALTRGYCHHLQELIIGPSTSPKDYHHLIAILALLRTGISPHLSKLILPIDMERCVIVGII